MNRRFALHRIALGCATAALAGGVAAQAADFPNRSVRVVVPYAAGGNADVITRHVMKDLSEHLKQPFVIDNRPGANSMVGTEFVAKSAPDGYTIGIVVGAYANNPSLYKKMPYTQADLTPVTIMAHTALVVVTGVPKIASFADLIRVGKAEELSYSTSGVGSNSHLWSVRLAQAEGMKNAVNVAYKGGLQAVADLTAGRVTFTLDTVAALGPQIQQDRLRALAVTSDKRSALLPNVPSIVELGYPDLVSYSWLAVLVPAGTPGAVIDKLQAGFADVLQRPELRARLQAMATEAVGSRPAEAAAFIAAETRRNGDVVKALGISLD